MKTTHNCFITTIHGITGQEIEEGTLPTGSRVRKIYSGCFTFLTWHANVEPCQTQRLGKSLLFYWPRWSVEYCQLINGDSGTW